MTQHTSTTASLHPAFDALRRFARRRPSGERCDLCAGELAADHQHLIEPSSRRLLCCCNACVLLFSGQQSARYRRVPRRVQVLRDFALTDAQWDDLLIPINLAFFFRSSTAGRVVAAYPSPAGATESLLTLEAWQELEQANPVLRELEPDVEALLVHRVGPARGFYRVSIDECYKLVGLIRSNWRGLSGGAEVWEAIGRFFAELNARSSPAGGSAHA
jgi:Family of unknown function (DUF5947)